MIKKNIAKMSQVQSWTFLANDFDDINIKQ